ncbi:MAG: hypothetical protein Alpg2KO_05560 [Alphaproteobacteria bacterium]
MRLPALALALMLSACAGTPPAPDGADADLHRLIYTGIDHIETYHVDGVESRVLAVSTLEKLEEVDAEIDVSIGDGGYRLSRSGTQLATASWPNGDNPSDWADLLATSIESARDASPELRRLTLDQFHQAVMDGLTAPLARFSRYVSPRRAAHEKRQRNGYGGIGMAFEIRDNEHYVVRVFPEAPAARAGVRPGDIILSVEGVNAADLTPLKLAEMIRGRIGSPLSIAVRRGEEVIPFEIRRARVVPTYMTTEIRGKVGVIHLTRFSETTHEKIDRAIEEFEKRIPGRPKGIVIDMQGNPGGLLDQAVDVIDLFVSRGNLSSAQGRHPGATQFFTAGWGAIADRVPIIVLLDGRSASAAEIVAAGLQENGRAIVAGSSSFGKGSVQRVFAMPDGGELLITWSYIYTPSGRKLDEAGVVPDLCFSGLEGDIKQLVSRAIARNARDATPLDRDSCPPQEELPPGTLDAVIDMLNNPGKLPTTLSAALPTPARKR